MSSSPNYAFNRSSGFTSQIWPINGRITFHRWIEDYRRALPSNTTHTHTLTHIHTPYRCFLFTAPSRGKKSRDTLFHSLETLLHPSDYDVMTLTASPRHLYTSSSLSKGETKHNLYTNNLLYYNNYIHIFISV